MGSGSGGGSGRKQIKTSSAQCRRSASSRPAKRTCNTSRVHDGGKATQAADAPSKAPEDFSAGMTPEQCTLWMTVSGAGAERGAKVWVGE